MELNIHQKLEYIRESLNIIVDKLVVDRPSRFFYIEKVFYEDDSNYSDWCRRISPMDEFNLVLTAIEDGSEFAIEWIIDETTAKVTVRAVVNFLDSELDITDPRSAYDIDMVYARLVELFKYSDEELSLYLKLIESSGIGRKNLK